MSIAVLPSMISRQKLEPLILACAVAISRFAFRSHDLYDLDSVNFALAMERFDPRVHQPHPPGYFLYICLGRLLNSILHDANLALVILSIAASCGVIIVIYKTALDWFGPREARFASILFLFSPLGWFHGIVALTYSVEAFFSALLGYLCWRMNCGNVALIAPAGVILGISAGIRPSSLLFLGPLYLFSLRNAELNRKLVGVAVLVLTLAAWLLPMIWASGGFGAYFGALVSLWRLVPSKNTVFNSSPATSIARACTIAFIFLLFVNSGYLLLLAAPACIWLGFWASEWYGSSAWRRAFKLAVIGVCAAVNVLIFLASPFYCSYRSVRQFEAQLEGIRTTLPQLVTTDDTLVV